MRRRDSGSFKANGPGKELKVSIKKSVGTRILRVRCDMIRIVVIIRGEARRIIERR